jgi:hypothetical protein
MSSPMRVAILARRRCVAGRASALRRPPGCGLKERNVRPLGDQPNGTRSTMQAFSSRLGGIEREGTADEGRDEQR